ncbi:MAG: hypothetical protein A2Y24_04910 [Clostridiales bacterium GWE2_32_10]|nr:MAG: hypothetical protein A2Y24_04910 [Clostridiales bacterium GWE2_32_10]HBY20286.1 hypothetical protein [Clostridiales bacterium]
MKEYLLSRNSEQIKLHNTYCGEQPEFLLELLNAPEVLRLDGISVSCGGCYTKFLKHKYFLSKLDHSYGMALIMWNHTRDKTQTLSALFHDISIPVFSHAGDFFLGDSLKQEASETMTSEIIRNSSQVMSFLEKNNISLSDVDDYKKYPLADNDKPRLAADRLETQLHFPLSIGSISLDVAKEIYKDITILRNEDDNPELGFKSLKYAEQFANIALDSDKKYYRSFEAITNNQMIVMILENVIKEGLINKEDIFIKTEKQIIDIIKTSGSRRLKSIWMYFEELHDKHKITVTAAEPFGNKLYVSKVNVKKRYIDPLVKAETGIYRISELSKAINESLKNYNNEVDNFYASVDIDF